MGTYLKHKTNKINRNNRGRTITVFGQLRRLWHALRRRPIYPLPVSVVCCHRRSKRSKIAPFLPNLFPTVFTVLFWLGCTLLGLLGIYILRLSTQFYALFLSIARCRVIIEGLPRLFAFVWCQTASFPVFLCLRISCPRNSTVFGSKLN